MVFNSGGQDAAQGQQPASETVDPGRGEVGKGLIAGRGAVLEAA